MDVRFVVGENQTLEGFEDRMHLQGMRFRDVDQLVEGLFDEDQRDQRREAFFSKSWERGVGQ